MAGLHSAVLILQSWLNSSSPPERCVVQRCLEFLVLLVLISLSLQAWRLWLSCGPQFSLVILHSTKLRRVQHSARATLHTLSMYYKRISPRSTSARSDSTISLTRSAKAVPASQPSSRLALAGSPSKNSTSVGR